MTNPGNADRLIGTERREENAKQTLGDPGGEKNPGNADRLIGTERREENAKQTLGDPRELEFVFPHRLIIFEVQKLFQGLGD